MVKPSRLSSPSEPSLYSSWTDHPGHQHHLHHHQGSDHSHANHSDEHQHVHHQVAMKNGVAGPPAASLLNLWNNSSSANNNNNSGSSAVNEDNNTVEDVNEDDNTSSSNQAAVHTEHNDLSQAALSPSAIGSIKGKIRSARQLCFENVGNSDEREKGELLLQFLASRHSLVYRAIHTQKKIVYVFSTMFQQKRESFSILC